MNHPQKFRVWDKANRRWVTEGEVSISSKGELLGWYVAQTGNSREDLEVCWFTGIKDKYGVDVYEKDLERVTDGTNTWTTHVHFDVEHGRWHRFDDYKYGEVVGNIYENTELLER